MRFDRILSVNLFTRTDVPALRRFYEDALDLPWLRDAAGILSFYPGQTTLNHVSADDDTRDLVGRKTGLLLRTRSEGNLARIIARVRGKGYTASDANFGPFRGGHRLHLEDPSGNRITLWEPPEEDDTPHLYEGPSAVAVHVRDIRRAMGFYTTVLELPMINQPDAHTATFFGDGTRLVVCERPSWVPSEPVRGETGVCFAASNPHSLIDSLSGRGVRFVEGPTEHGDTVAAAFCDLDGNRYALLGR